MPYKFHASRRHHIPIAQYRVTNWPDHDRGLVRRGDIRCWIGESVPEQWIAPKRRTPGGQRRFAEVAISVCGLPPGSTDEPPRNARKRRVILRVDIARIENQTTRSESARRTGQSAGQAGPCPWRPRKKPPLPGLSRRLHSSLWFPSRSFPSSGFFAPTVDSRFRTHPRSATAPQLRLATDIVHHSMWPDALFRGQGGNDRARLRRVRPHRTPPTPSTRTDAQGMEPPIDETRDSGLALPEIPVNQITRGVLFAGAFFSQASASDHPSRKPEPTAHTSSMSSPTRKSAWACSCVPSGLRATGASASATLDPRRVRLGITLALARRAIALLPMIPI